MNAHTRMSHTAPDQASDRLPDGSLVVSVEQLMKFGDGDAKRGRRQLRLMLASEQDRRVSEGPTERPATVRIAGVPDEPAILALLVRDLNENAAHVASIDEDRVMVHIQVGTRRKGGIVGVIDGPDGAPVAVTIMHPAQWWWSRQWFVQEITNYVHADHRKSHHIDDLIRFEKWVQETWTKNFGYRVYLLCGVLSGRRVREKIMMYKRKFWQAGIFCVYPSPYRPDEE